jgi:hypothetical protein
VNARAPGDQIIFWAACLCVALNGFLLIGPSSFGLNLLRVLRKPDKVTYLSRAIDRSYSDLPLRENAALTFRNFGRENESLLELIYYRSCYSAYPRQVFVRPDVAVINNGRELLATQPFEPNKQWLNQHRVGRTIIYEQQPDASVKTLVSRHELP